MRRAERIEIRATEEQKARWTAAAGGDLSSWIRDTLDAEAASSPPAAHPVAAPEPVSQEKTSLPAAIVSAAHKQSKGCPMYAPRGTKCRSCGQLH